MVSWRILAVVALAAVGPGGRAAIAESAGDVLETAPWTVVDSRGAVRAGAAGWRGGDDLSFRYRTRVAKGTLFVQILVTDDVVVRGTDRVELRLVDPRLAEEHARTGEGLRHELLDVDQPVEEDDGSLPMDAATAAELRNARRRIAEDAVMRPARGVALDGVEATRRRSPRRGWRGRARGKRRSSASRRTS